MHSISSPLGIRAIALLTIAVKPWSIALAFTMPTKRDAGHTTRLMMMMTPDNIPPTQTIQQQPSTFLTTTPTTNNNNNNALTNGIIQFLTPPAANAADDDDDTTPAKPPTDSEIKLLRSALGAFYGERNPEKAVDLLTQAIDAWERQPPDEKAALYRVRGDVNLVLVKPQEAIDDFTKAIDLLDGPGGEKADPEEIPAARLGRARANRGLQSQTQTPLTSTQLSQTLSDYQTSLLLSASPNDSTFYDSTEEQIQNGMKRNPYAAWEYGTTQRNAGNYDQAALIHQVAKEAFDDIGDAARSVISDLERGIDLASGVAVGSKNKKDVKREKAIEVLNTAIASTKGIEGNDVELLQRVIIKECEARIALASVLWEGNDRVGAERELGEACVRLDQLEADYEAREAARVKSGAMPEVKVEKLKFSLDEDGVGPGEINCSRFKNEKFLRGALMWPEALTEKVLKLERLG